MGLRIQLRHLILDAVMKVNRSLMEFPEGLHFIHFRNFPSVVLKDKLVPDLINIAQAEIPCGKCAA